MPTCCDCGREAGKKHFSKSQLKKHPDKRRCIGCASQLASISGAKEQVPVPDLLCCICLDNEATNSNPIVRDCACRGTAGHVHIQCLVRFAAVKSRQMLDNEEIESGDIFSPNNPNPWETCMTCKQEFCKFSISCGVLAEAALELYPTPESSFVWHKTALRINASREEALENTKEAFHYAMRLLDVLRIENTPHENDGDGAVVPIGCELCSAMTKVLSLKGDGDENKWCKIERHLDSSEAILDGLDESDRDLLAVHEAKIDIMRMRSVIAVGRGGYEAAVMHQECVVDSICKLEGESMRSSNELWRLSELLFDFIDTVAGMKKGRESLRIAETLRGRHDTIVKRRKSYLEEKADVIRVR